MSKHCHSCNSNVADVFFFEDNQCCWDCQQIQDETNNPKGEQ